MFFPLRRPALCAGFSLLLAAGPGLAHADRDDRYGFPDRPQIRHHHHWRHYHPTTPAVIEEPVIVERRVVYPRYRERIVERSYVPVYPGHPVYPATPAVTIGVAIPPLVIPLR